MGCKGIRFLSSVLKFSTIRWIFFLLEEIWGDWSNRNYSALWKELNGTLVTLVGMLEAQYERKKCPKHDNDITFYFAVVIVVIIDVDFVVVVRGAIGAE